MKQVVKITDIRPVTHDVKCFRIEKPAGYTFEPGHATELSINEPGLEEETRPFTFTCLKKDPFLEFTIKRYPEHKGVTDRLHQLKPGDELILRNPGVLLNTEGRVILLRRGQALPHFCNPEELYDESKTAGTSFSFQIKQPPISYEKELVNIWERMQFSF
jgi:hypothetical protein